MQSRTAGLFLILVLLSLSIVSGCTTGKRDMVEEQRIPAPPEPAVETTTPEPNGPDFEMAAEDGKTWFEIGVPQGTDVSPEYENRTLTLHFSPSVPAVDAAGMEPKGVISDIDVISGPVVGNMQKLVVTTQEQVQFLLSRPQPEVLRVLLVSTTAPEKMEQAAPSEEKITLERIDFSKDDQGWFYVRIKADGAIEYFPRPAKEGHAKVVFPDLQVPEAYAKLYRLHKFDLGIKSAFLQNVDGGAELLMSMGSRRPMHIERTDSELVLKFLGNPGGQVAENPNGNGKDNPAAPVQRAMGQNSDELQEFNTLFPGMRSEYTGQPISINLQDADVEHVLRLISEVSGYNLILDDNVSGKISLKLESVPWDQALDLVLLQKDLGMVLRGNIMRIATKSKLQQEQADIQQARRAALEAQESMKNLAPLHTEFIQINYATASEIMPKAEDFLSERGKVTFDQRTNMLIATGTRDQLDNIKSVIDKLDRPERQVLIEARIVFATDDFQRSLGVKWGGGFQRSDSEFHQGLYGTGSGITAGTNPEGLSPAGFAVNAPSSLSTLGLGYYISKLTGTNLYSLDAQLQLGEEKNLTKIISSPRLVTLNNQRAEIVQGTKIATPTESESGGTTIEYQDAFLKLSVLPQITPDNKLILDLDISDDAPSGDDISTRSARTRLIVNDGETLVIGGVNKTTERFGSNRVPGAHQVPLLGWLFKNKDNQDNKEELLIFIRPKVL
ncbi:MAG: type IV pilus secretin PilQ [Desulfovibrionales bacterium]